MPNKLIDIINITKSYDENVILDQLNLYIRENEFLTLLGPSGCGKTTLLRILGGFETPDSGDIIFDGKNINNLPPNRRQLNTVFQKYALLCLMLFLPLKSVCHLPQTLRLMQSLHLKKVLSVTRSA